MENDLSRALELRRKGRLIESNQLIKELLLLDTLHYTIKGRSDLIFWGKRLSRFLIM